MKTPGKGNVFFAVLLMAAYTAQQAAAAVVDLRATARANTNLIHHYTFEGPHQGPSAVATNMTHDAYLLDRKGDLHLAAWNYAPYRVEYGPGADALSRSGIGVDVTNTFTKGAAWSTTNTVALPATLTVECVLCPNALPAADSGSGYIVGTRNASDTDRRGYFLYINSDGYFVVNVGKLAHTVSFYDALETNHWYYAVTTFAVNGEQTTVNAYVADLTAGETRWNTPCRIIWSPAATPPWRQGSASGCSTTAPFSNTPRRPPSTRWRFTTPCSMPRPWRNIWRSCGVQRRSWLTARYSPTTPTCPAAFCRARGGPATATSRPSALQLVRWWTGT